MTVAFASRAAASRTPRSVRRLAFTALALAGILAPVFRAYSQAVPAAPDKWEFRLSSGAFVPAGAQRHALKDAHITAAQVSWLVRPSIAVTGTFGWARSRDVTLESAPKLDVFTSDAGIEFRSNDWVTARRVSFSPFVGVGGGARSYNYRNLDVDARNNLAGYASVGGEVGSGRAAVRVEVRDYVAGFKPLATAGRSSTRNDVVLMAALSLNRRTSGK